MDEKSIDPQIERQAIYRRSSFLRSVDLENIYATSYSIIIKVNKNINVAVVAVTIKEFLL